MGTQTPERTLYDREVDERLDKMLADAVPPPTCEWKLKRGSLSDPSNMCGALATWLLVIRCGHSAYLCSEHHDKQVVLLGSTLRVKCIRDGRTTYYEWIQL